MKKKNNRLVAVIIASGFMLVAGILLFLVQHQFKQVEIVEDVQYNIVNDKLKLTEIQFDEEYIKIEGVYEEKEPLKGVNLQIVLEDESGKMYGIHTEYVEISTKEQLETGKMNQAGYRGYVYYDSAQWKNNGNEEYVVWVLNNSTQELMKTGKTVTLAKEK